MSRNARREQECPTFLKQARYGDLSARHSLKQQRHVPRYPGFRFSTPLSTLSIVHSGYAILRVVADSDTQ